MENKVMLRIGIVGKPFIGESSDEWNKNIIVNGNLNNLIYKAGHVPVGITPISPEDKFNQIDEVDPYRLTNFDKRRIVRQINYLDGIILQGGMQTLAYEEFIAKIAIANTIPIMGICAGFNTLVRVCGGKIIQNPTDSHDREPDEISHSLIIEPESNFYRLMGRKVSVDVNSVHWMIAPMNGIPPSLSIAAISPDKLVEVVEGKHKPIYGYKFHPEIMALEENKTYNPLMKNVFNDFFCKCAEFKRDREYNLDKVM